MESIIVWGTGRNAIDFIMNNPKQKICAFVDSNKKVDDNSWDDIPILLPDEAKELINTYFVVVASSEHTYWSIRKTLIGMGRSEFRDFTFHRIYLRKMAIVYGNCHTSSIKEGLRLSPEFRDEYGIYPLPQIQDLAGCNLHLEKAVLEKCKLFIHQSVQQENRYGEEYSSNNMISNLKSDCRTIAIPNLYGMSKCFYPHNEFEKGGTGKKIRGVTYYPFRDSYIEMRTAENASCKEITEEIENKNILSTGEISRQLEAFFNKVKDREKDWDIKILEYIMENYQMKQLFYDANHPSEHIFYQILKDLYDYLGIDKTYIIFDFLQKSDDLEIPFYGQVINELGLKYSNDIMRISSANSIAQRPIDLQDYINEYVMCNC